MDTLKAPDQETTKALWDSPVYGPRLREAENLLLIAAHHWRRTAIMDAFERLFAELAALDRADEIPRRRRAVVEAAVSYHFAKGYDADDPCKASSIEKALRDIDIAVIDLLAAAHDFALGGRMMDPVTERQIHKELAATESGLAHYVNVALTMTVTSPKEAEEMGQVAEWAHGHIKALTAKRDEILRPLKEAEKRLRELFQPSIRAMEQVKAHAKGSIGQYLAAVEATNREAMRMAAEAARFGDSAGVVQAAALALPTAPPEAVRPIEAWEYQVTAPDLVPREFLAVDHAKLAAYCGKGNPAPVPGVVFTKTIKVAMRPQRR